jgi:nicotinamide phosphoribosyltransferase
MFLENGLAVPSASLSTDFYKIGHPSMYHKESKVIFTNFTPRSDKYFNHYWDDQKRGVISAGISMRIKMLVSLWSVTFFQLPKEVAIVKYKRIVDASLGKDKVSLKHLEALHTLGYLPLEIRCIPEGYLVPIQVPVYTVHNTNPKVPDYDLSGKYADNYFAWLTNYFESVLSDETWKVMTNATIAFHYKRLGMKFAEETCDNNLHVDFQFHDFSFRGLGCSEEGYKNGIAHIMSFSGTDTVLAIEAVHDFYRIPEGEFVAGSIPATEHSVATTNIMYIVEDLRKQSEIDGTNLSLDALRLKAEKIYLEHYITSIVPEGLCSYVADSYDYWSVLTVILPDLLESITKRAGKLVIRPDSGDPVKVICGLRYPEKNFISESEAYRYINEMDASLPYPEAVMVNGNFYAVTEDEDEFEGFYIQDEILPTHEVKGSIEVLWDIFGGSVNTKGFKVLNDHIGLIYGDSITIPRAVEIFTRLKEKGFASSNVVLGIGSFTYQMNTRDTFGFACKATGSIIGDRTILVSKEPKTDPGKKSARGFLKVIRNDKGVLQLVEDLTLDQIDSDDNELRMIFKNGKFTEAANEDFTVIRQRLNSQL